MIDGKVILFEKKYNKIIDIAVLIILIYFVFNNFNYSSSPILFLIIVLIFFSGYLQRSITSSDLIFIDQNDLIFKYIIFHNKNIKYNILSIDKIIFHRSSGRLDRNSLLLTFKENSEKKYIYFAGNDKDCEILLEGLKNAEIIVISD